MSTEMCAEWPTDAALEALIVKAQSARDEATARYDAEVKKLSDLADEIEAAIPGADLADLGAS